MTREQTPEAKLRRMTETPIPRLVLTLSAPTIVSMLISALYNMADTYFVGLMKNPSATAAVGVCFPLMAILQAVGFMFGHGSGNYISRALGAQDHDNARRMSATGFFSALFSGGVIAVLGVAFLHPLVRVLGSTETIAPFAVDYAFYILLGSPWLVASLVLNNQLRFQGNAFFAMFGVVAGAVLNVALDPLFIFTFGMGVGGAALATIISQFVSFVLLLLGTRKARAATSASGLTSLRRRLPCLRRFGAAAFHRFCAKGWQASRPLRSISRRAALAIRRSRL